MIEKIAPWIKGKKVLILGFGREGRSSFRLIKRLGGYSCLDIADILAPKEPPGEGHCWRSGPDYQKCLNAYDVVFKSPGIVLEEKKETYTCLIVSQTEVFFSLFRDQIVGITGTKGKSTQATLLYHLLKGAGMDVLLAGNIGIPAFDHIEEIGPKTKIVFELSCHQLEYLSVSPHIGILMNIYEEHLDHYGTMEAYVEAKRHIYKNQREGDILICNTQCLPLVGSCCALLVRAMEGKGEAQLQVIPEGDGARLLFGERSILIRREATRLQGRHNQFNIGIAYAVCCLLGVEDKAFLEGLRTYEPLPHRLQYIGKKDGVKYYDDSISTSCGSTVAALKTLQDAATVLIGGMDRGIDYGMLLDYLEASSLPNIILMEESGKRILDEARAGRPALFRSGRLIYARHLDEAVEKAKALSAPGSSCVLSPAAASYGHFKNFEERGEAFKRLVFGGGEGVPPLSESEAKHKKVTGC